MVKNEDINHHGTLYAGRVSDWLVEAGFIATASLANPENIVCSQIHGLKFSSPIYCGDIIRIDSKVVFTGRSRMVSYVRVVVHEKRAVEGFITFFYVDLQGKSLPHGIEITPVSEEDKELFQKASELPR